jgi:hypothetical protein
VTSGFWNVNEWITVKDSDNFILRSECVQFLNVDILCIAETYLCNNDNIELPGNVLTKFGVLDFGISSLKTS